MKLSYILLLSHHISDASAQYLINQFNLMKYLIFIALCIIAIAKIDKQQASFSNAISPQLPLTSSQNKTSNPTSEVIIKQNKVEDQVKVQSADNNIIKNNTSSQTEKGKEAKKSIKDSIDNQTMTAKTSHEQNKTANNQSIIEPKAVEEVQAANRTNEIGKQAQVKQGAQNQAMVVQNTTKKESKIQDSEHKQQKTHKSGRRKSKTANKSARIRKPNKFNKTQNTISLIPTETISNQSQQVSNSNISSEVTLQSNSTHTQQKAQKSTKQPNQQKSQDQALKSANATNNSSQIQMIEKQKAAQSEKNASQIEMNHEKNASSVQANNQAKLQKQTNPKQISNPQQNEDTSTKNGTQISNQTKETKKEAAEQRPIINQTKLDDTQKVNKSTPFVNSSSVEEANQLVSDQEEVESQTVVDEEDSQTNVTSNANIIASSTLNNTEKANNQAKQNTSSPDHTPKIQNSTVQKQLQTQSQDEQQNDEDSVDQEQNIVAEKNITKTQNLTEPEKKSKELEDEQKAESNKTSSKTKQKTIEKNNQTNNETKAENTPTPQTQNNASVQLNQTKQSAVQTSDQTTKISNASETQTAKQKEQSLVEQKINSTSSQHEQVVSNTQSSQQSTLTNETNTPSIENVTVASAQLNQTHQEKEVSPQNKQKLNQTSAAKQNQSLPLPSSEQAQPTIPQKIVQDLPPILKEDQPNNNKNQVNNNAEIVVEAKKQQNKSIATEVHHFSEQVNKTESSGDSKSVKPVMVEPSAQSSSNIVVSDKPQPVHPIQAKQILQHKQIPIFQSKLPDIKPTTEANLTQIETTKPKDIKVSTNNINTQSKDIKTTDKKEVDKAIDAIEKLKGKTFPLKPNPEKKQQKIATIISPKPIESSQQPPKFKKDTEVTNLKIEPQELKNKPVQFIQKTATKEEVKQNIIVPVAFEQVKPISQRINDKKEHQIQKDVIDSPEQPKSLHSAGELLKQLENVHDKLLKNTEKTAENGKSKYLSKQESDDSEDYRPEQVDDKISLHTHDDSNAIMIAIYAGVGLLVALYCLRSLKSTQTQRQGNANSDHEQFREDEDFSLSGPEVAERLDDD